MQTNTRIPVAFLAATLILGACGGSRSSAKVEALNRRLATIRVDGFPFLQSRLWGRPGKQLSAVRLEMLAIARQMPTAAKIVVKGHTCDRESGHSARMALRAYRVASLRAKRVRAVLVTWGISEQRLAVLVVCNNDKRGDKAGTAREQRRVSFSVRMPG